ncbi:helix-turn-helix domain-containing protein [Parvimonas parva]|uniref:Helix-turn-helix domain-containing protein n=1 Tax=Parvimonas parva TaxID=2769485 RepID=A0ABS1C9F7_9FIRM|nr:helix-turn-helix domain-containing protein [Parvimonas parva]MBK1468680.1 helix-turn-helix domain-containing protein [Parvimonas parva]
MHNNCNIKHKHLTIDLRKLIEKWKKERKSNREIVRLLGKSPQIINNEIKRGLVIQRTCYGKFKKVYKAEFARLYEVFYYEKIYYAHPYSSYERGSNENHNRLIRRFLPKGTKNTTQKRVAFIKNWINNYPKKLFNYRTPFEVFSIG